MVRDMTNTARTVRLTAALATCANLNADEAKMAADMLDVARPAILRGADPVSAIQAQATRIGNEAAYRAAEAAICVIEALCGSVEKLVAIERERRAAVIRYAIAVAAQGTDPSSGWGPVSVAIGRQAWAEVSALRSVKAA